MSGVHDDRVGSKSLKAVMESRGDHQTWLNPPPADEIVAHTKEKQHR
jgi:hypothetical protein